MHPEVQLYSAGTQRDERDISIAPPDASAQTLCSPALLGEDKQSCSTELNLDIYVCIMQNLPKDGLIRLMTSCRILHTAGVPILLGCGVTLNSNDAVSSFCQFMSVDTSQRASLLRELYISQPTKPLILNKDNDPEGLILRLTDILVHATSLKKLVIRGFTNLLDLDTLGTAIAGLTSIEVLELQSAGKKGIDVLRKMQSPVHSLAISYKMAYKEIDAVNDPKALNSTLTTLTVTGANFAGRPTCRYSVLHTLKVHSVRIIPSSPVLLIAFPNLKHPSFSGVDAGVMLRADDRAAIRRRNSQFQALATWPQLESLEGNLECLYGLAISCKVHKLCITKAALGTTGDWQSRYHSVIADTRPTELVSHISFVFPSISPLPVLSFLPMTKVVVVFDIDSRTILDNILAGCIESIKETSVEDIAIRFHYSIFLTTMQKFDRFGEGEPAVVARMRNLDLLGFARQLTESRPSLHHIRLRSDIGLDCSMERSWTVKSRDDGIRFELEEPVIPTLGDWSVVPYYYI